MEINEQLIQAITEAVVKVMEEQSGMAVPVSGQNGEKVSRMAPKRSYAGWTLAKQGTDPKEVVIGVGPAFQREIKATITGIPLDQVIENLCAGIEEEGMVPRVIKVLRTSDVGFMGLDAAKLSGSGIAIGLQSKGTAVIHQKDLYPLSNLELFPPGASDDPGNLPENRAERGALRKGRESNAGGMYQRPHGQGKVSGEGCPDAHG